MIDERDAELSGEEYEPDRGPLRIMNHRDLGKSEDGKYLTSEFTFDTGAVLTVDFKLKKTNKGSRQMRSRYINDIRALVAYGLPADALDKFVVAREVVERRALPRVGDEVVITATNNPVWKEGQRALVMELGDGGCMARPLGAEYIDLPEENGTWWINHGECARVSGEVEDEAA